MELLETDANPFKLYKQAKRILKGTSRASNPDWYNRAFELELQWHLWVGTEEVVSALYSVKLGQWFEGPRIPSISFETDDEGKPIGLETDSRNQLHEILRQILGAKQFGGKPKSLGIVFHLADFIRVRDLAPDFAGDANFDLVDELLATEPGIALGDDSVEAGDGLWRVFPLLGVKESDKLSVGIQVSSQYNIIVDELRTYGEMRNVPVVAEVISAALEGIAALPSLSPETKSFENTISLIQFNAFTLVCATGSRGEILMIRPLPHRSGKTLTPTETAELLTNTAALLDLKTPRVLLVSMPGIPVDELRDLLSIYVEANPEAEIDCANAKEHPLCENVPGNRFEFAFLTAPYDAKQAATIPLLQARARWAVQDFCGPTSHEAAKMPTRGDLRILKFTALGQKVALALMLAFAGWTGTDYFTKMRSEAWKLPATAADEMQIKLATAQKEKRELEHWENLLTKRSEGWVAMQALLSLFPDDGGVILSGANYRTGATESTGSGDLVGFSREWNFVGYANPKVATNLSSMGSRSHVVKLLNEIAEETRADYIKVDSETRDLAVSFQQRQGTMPPTATFPANVARHFRVAFELGITHSISAEDELAMRTTSLEKK